MQNFALFRSGMVLIFDKFLKLNPTPKRQLRRKKETKKQTKKEQKQPPGRMFPRVLRIRFQNRSVRAKRRARPSNMFFRANDARVLDTNFVITSSRIALHDC